MLVRLHHPDSFIARTVVGIIETVVIPYNVCIASMRQMNADNAWELLLRFGGRKSDIVYPASTVFKFMPPLQTHSFNGASCEANGLFYDVWLYNGLMALKLIPHAAKHHNLTLSYAPTASAAVLIYAPYVIVLSTAHGEFVQNHRMAAEGWHVD